MPWDLNQINDYFMQHLPNPAGAFDDGRAAAFKDRVLRQKIAADQQAQATALAREQSKANARARLNSDPSASAVANYITLFPEDAEPIKQQWELRSKDVQQADLRELSAIHGYLNAGMPDRAKAALQRRIDADKTAGQDTSDDEEMLAAIEEDPKSAAGMVALTLSAIAGPEKVGEVFNKVSEANRDNELQTPTVRKATADATTAEVGARYAPKVAESNLANDENLRATRTAQIQNQIDQLKLGWARLGFDENALATNTNLKLEELSLKGGPEGASLTEMTKAVGNAQQQIALADRTEALADKITAEGLGGYGLATSFNEGLKGALGIQGNQTALRQEYQRIVNSQAISNLPPGAASDKDIMIARQGFPKMSADGEYLASFLRGMAKIQRLSANADSAKADWISENGNVGKARRDLNVSGVAVPAGTSFTDYLRNRAKIGTVGAPPTRSYLERYGK